MTDDHRHLSFHSIATVLDAIVALPVMGHFIAPAAGLSATGRPVRT